MEKRRGFLLATLLLLLCFTIFNGFIVFPAGYRISDGVMFIIDGEGAAIYLGIVEIILAGLSLLTIFGGVGMSLFFLLLSFVLFLISGKKPKIMIVTYVAFGLTLVTVLGTFLSLLSLELLANADVFAMNMTSMFTGGHSYYGYYYYLKSTYAYIQDVVRGGLGMLVSLLLMPVVVIPFVTFVLGIVLGRGKKKVQEQPEVIEVK